jgi:ubiquinone/menaquinone biosynthesis C-methylase UbiE
MKSQVDKGFSNISTTYESLDETSSLIQWMRGSVRSHLERKLQSGSSILEINAGTGLDAVYLAEKGYRVHATDMATGMVDFLNQKSQNLALKGRLTFEKLAFEELPELNSKHDYIFSNFGGLNCVDAHDLQKVIKSFKGILNPGGGITLVIMPPYTPWEWLSVLKGKKYGFRRFRKTIAHVAGAMVPTYYHKSSLVKKFLKDDFYQISIENLSFIGPAGYKIDFPTDYPRLFKFLTAFDKPSSKIPFLKGIGDYYIISARLK